MSTIKISELNSIQSLTNSDVLPIVNEAETKKVSISQLQDIFASKQYIDEKIESVSVDLTDYYTKSEVDTQINTAINKSITSALESEY